MNHGYYILDKKGNPIAESNVLKWGEWFKNADRHVAKTEIGNIQISTVFLALDHNFMRRGLPVLWETMVFGGSLDGEMDRYTSLKDAKKGHEDMVEKVKQSLSELKNE